MRGNFRQTVNGIMAKLFLRLFAVRNDLEPIAPKSRNAILNGGIVRVKAVLLARCAESQPRAAWISGEVCNTSFGLGRDCHDQALPDSMRRSRGKRSAMAAKLWIYLIGSGAGVVCGNGRCFRAQRSLPAALRAGAWSM